MFSATRRFVFEAGHRLIGHQGKCKYLHGHRYVAEVTYYSTRLDWLGMVMDFGEMKATLGRWIDENLDHNLILNPRDPLLEACDLFAKELRWKYKYAMFDRMPFIMPDDRPNPTAENIAAVLFSTAIHTLPTNLTVLVRSVRLWETENCYVDYMGPPIQRPGGGALLKTPPVAPDPAPLPDPTPTPESEEKARAHESTARRKAGPRAPRRVA